MSTIQPERGVQARRWTKAEYYRLGEAGFFNGQRVELIEGRILRVYPLSPPCANTICLLSELLRNQFGPEFSVRVRSPLDVGPSNEPEPHLMVVPGPIRRYMNAHPTTALLIVEVCDDSLPYYRRKRSLYARAGVPEYWIVNLRRPWLEVYRAPTPDSAHRSGYRYASRTDLLPGATVSPLALPAATIPVADLLP